MTIWEILIISVGLAGDAFAVSVCKGLSSKKSFLKTGLVCGAWFGAFQGLMPLLGWLLGSTVASYIDAYKAYISFVLLAFLGGKMIVEAVKDLKEGKGCECECEAESGVCDVESKDSSLSPAIMAAMAIATSIDALAVGFDFAVRDVNILLAVSIIGAVTFACCFVGSIVGAKLGSKYKSPAEIVGGCILVAMGLKFLIEGLISL